MLAKLPRGLCQKKKEKKKRTVWSYITRTNTLYTALYGTMLLIIISITGLLNKIQIQEPFYSGFNQLLASDKSCELYWIMGVVVLTIEQPPLPMEIYRRGAKNVLGQGKVVKTVFTLANFLPRFPTLSWKLWWQTTKWNVPLPWTKLGIFWVWTFLLMWYLVIFRHIKAEGLHIIALTVAYLSS